MFIFNNSPHNFAQLLFWGCMSLFFKVVCNIFEDDCQSFAKGYSKSRVRVTLCCHNLGCVAVIWGEFVLLITQNGIATSN